MANNIEAILHNPQTINTLLPSIPDTPIVSKAITQLSGQSNLTCPEAESSAPKTVSKLDDSSNPGVDIDST